MSSVATSRQREDLSGEPETNLSAQRWKLQGEVIRLLDSDIDGKEKELLLRGKKVAYNQVMDNLQPYRAGVNPFDKFPTEILETIFLDYITYWEPNYKYLEKRVDLLLPLTVVSKRWRNYIHSEPILWDCIRADGKKKNAVVGVVQGLELSRDGPLTIILKIWPNLWRQICPYLLDHRDRIMTLVTLEGCLEPDVRDYAPSIEGAEMIRDLVSLPNLRTVTGFLGYVDETLKEMLNQCRSLECIIGFDLDSEWLLKAQNNVAIQEICTQQDFALLLPVLESIPSIRKVTVFEMSRRNLIQASPSPLIHSVEPLNWTYLCFWQRYPLVSLFYRLPAADSSGCLPNDRRIRKYHYIPP